MPEWCHKELLKKFQTASHKWLLPWPLRLKRWFSTTNILKFPLPATFSRLILTENHLCRPAGFIGKPFGADLTSRIKPTFNR